MLYQPGQSGEMFSVQLTLHERLGDWTKFDPADPPRLTGELHTTDADAKTIVEGPFEAAFCDAFAYVLTD